jgi:hypothetical protein
LLPLLHTSNKTRDQKEHKTLLVLFLFFLFFLSFSFLLSGSSSSSSSLDHKTLHGSHNYWRRRHCRPGFFLGGLLLFFLSTMTGCCNTGSPYTEQQHGRKYLTSRTHNTAAAAATDLLQLFHYETRRRRSSDSGNHTANATATGKCAEWMNE